ncbi:ATP-binding cassette domain-containing protein [Clostridium sp. CM027]|uniref:ABC transporter ATP-binding protein/permease n=1 Tax=Clostridium sp. CM027 TaxID=2849865 RepID=UPI001C6E4115|nr:ABC transporter ATP-binding protein/permease [Clostridium sp. CM027]MBW9146476.1 ATP-binding cassette domain-containing protein [Clostridium sp. CM027]UVE41976.1 ATP-binding cassette domain-containing protein [Clostridium sp. CM027]
MLQIKNLRKTYKIGKHQVIALDDVSFDLPNGKLVAIVGPSGCGKTTMMNLIGALDKDFEGDVIVNGKSLKEAGEKDLDTYRKNTVGFIFQQFNLLNSLTSIQNVELALDLSGISKQNKTKKACSLLEQVGLSNQMKKKVNLLSGGQRQRVAIARALANDPEIILADEPTGALDVKTGEQVMELLKEISKDKLVLMVTHAPDLAKAYADLIVKMEDGKLISIEENMASVSTAAPIIDKIETKSKMSFLSSLKISLRNAWLKKGRTLATAIGTSIGICGIALAIAITSGTTNAVDTQVKGIFPTNAITVGLKENTDKSLKNIKPLKYSDINSVMSLDKNIYAYYFQIGGKGIPVAQFYSLDQSIIKDEKLMTKLSDQSTREKLVMMMAPGVLEDVKNDIQYGSLPEAGSTNEIVISLSTAKDLEKNGGDLKDLIGKNMYVRYLKQGSNPHSEQSGIPEVPIVKAWKIAGIANTTTLIDTYYATSDWAINFYEIEFKIDKITLESPSLVLYSSNTKDLDASLQKLNDSQDKYKFELTGKTISSQVDGAMKQVRYALMGFSGISILVAALMISIVVYISVLERIKEIGILRAVGARKKDILNIFVAESFIIGVLSAGIGLLFTLGASKLINSAVYGFLKNISANAPYMEVAKLPLADAGLILLFCVVLSMISGFYPSLKASKMDPIDALRSR